MIKESGKVVRRGGERIWGILELLGKTGTLASSTIIRPRVVTREDVATLSPRAPLASDVASDASPLANVGPIPDELRMDPFPADSVPWCIREAEKEQGRTRALMIWKVALVVSWSVTGVALLRAFGML